MNILAFQPLYDPLFALFPLLSEYWLWLVLPLVVAISVVYKGTRVADLKHLPRDAAIMTAQVVVVMAVAAILLYFGYYTYVKFAAPLVP